MNPSQERAWETYHDRFVVPVPRRETSTSVAFDAHVVWTEVFGRSAPLIVEIGCGVGESLFAAAAANPDVDFVAFEVFGPAIASTLSRIGRAGITNVRIVEADGAEGVSRLFGPASITELWTFFPDPWHKKRHAKRRLVSPEFATLVADRLVPGGLWRLATDWADYAVWMQEVLNQHPGFTHEGDGTAPRFSGRAVTRYERRGLDAGRAIIDLTYRRPS